MHDHVVISLLDVMRIYPRRNVNDCKAKTQSHYRIAYHFH